MICFFDFARGARFARQILRQFRIHPRAQFSAAELKEGALTGGFSGCFREHRIGLNFEPRVLPCGHYTTGETPYKFMDGWYLGWFVYRAFKALREEKAAAELAGVAPVEVEEETVSG